MEVGVGVGVGVGVEVGVGVGVGVERGGRCRRGRRSWDRDAVGRRLGLTAARPAPVAPHRVAVGARRGRRGHGLCVRRLIGAGVSTVDASHRRRAGASADPVAGVTARGEAGEADADAVGGAGCGRGRARRRAHCGAGGCGVDGSPCRPPACSESSSPASRSLPRRRRRPGRPPLSESVQVEISSGNDSQSRSQMR